MFGTLSIFARPRYSGSFCAPAKPLWLDSDWHSPRRQADRRGQYTQIKGFAGFRAFHDKHHIATADEARALGEALLLLADEAGEEADRVQMREAA